MTKGLSTALRCFAPTRRRFLATSSAMAVAAIARPARLRAQEQQAEAQDFSFEGLIDRMEAAAQQPYRAPAQIEGPWADLDYDAYRRISFDTDKAIWKGADAPFELHAYPMGWLFREPLEVFEVADGMARPIGFVQDDFEIDETVQSRFAEAGEAPFPGVAGFRLNAPLNDPSRYDEVVSFLGASYFRALGQGNIYGISARGLAVNTAIGGAEEFPRFSQVWIERPDPGANQIVFYTALESQSVTGAYRFVLRPGETTVMDVSARLFMREDVDQLGIAPLTSMYLFGPSDPGDFDDYREAVHDSEGLVLTSSGRTSFRQLANPGRLGNSYIAARDPQYFGLVQRTRDFDEYGDAGAHYERRPSLMVEPIGEWGAGTVRLIEIPSELEINDNIVAFWVPEKEARAGDALMFDYRLHWGSDPVGATPQTAHVLRTMTGKGGVSGVEGDNGHRKFVIDFTGGKLSELDGDSEIVSRHSVSGGTIAEAVLSPIAETGVWRLVLEVDAEVGNTVELRADLAHGDTPLSETWLYQWQTE